MKQMKVVMDGTIGWRSVKPEAIEQEVAPIYQRKTSEVLMDAIRVQREGR